jgi:hypothetical protein
MVTGWMPNHDGAARLRSLLDDVPADTASTAE